MSEILRQLKTFAGEVKDSDFLSLMLRRSSGGASPLPSDYFYYDGTQYWTASNDERKVVVTNASPSDVIDVEWKKSDETFLDYVERKLSLATTEESTTEESTTEESTTEESTTEDNVPSSEGALSNESPSVEQAPLQAPKTV